MTTKPTTNHSEYEITAVRGALDAVTTGMGWIASGVDWDGSLPPDDEAAMERLQRVFNGLEAVYSAALIEDLLLSLSALA